ncbi:type IV toxin-antitoxin system AbiEi family antitoxin domain-containing protein [Kribbella sp. NPDC055110]
MNRRLEVIAAGRGGWFTRPDAHAAGYSDSELRQRVRSGQWLRMSFNSYVDPRAWPDEPPWERATRRHLLHVRMASERLGDVVVSHQSAALLHGLPVWGTDLARAHFTRVASGRPRVGRGVQVHRGTPAVDEIVELGGLNVTSVDRAIVETACTTSYEVGVVMADVALRGLTTREQLAAVVRRHRHWRGLPAAQAAVLFADARSESVGESRLRVLMANHGLPEPELQVEIWDAGGRLIGRVDFLLAGVLVVEFDGAMKYGDNADAVLAEKYREDRLRECGYGVARVNWAELTNPHETAARLERALRAHATGTGNRRLLVPSPRRG